jgi:hydrogenase nickel incorporation protein HypA/HybF
MHEASIVSGLMQVLLDHAERHDVHHISRVTVKVGKLRSVEPRALTGCFELFAEGTIAEGADLVIDTVGIRGRCRDCASEFDIEGFFFHCPSCEGRRVEVTAGEELYIESFET